MFLLNSRLSRLAATPVCLEMHEISQTGAPLIPKLRGQFAEFLNVVYLAHLRLLALSTCVGLRYGHSPLNTRNEAFLGGIASVNSPSSKEVRVP